MKLIVVYCYIFVIGKVNQCKSERVIIRLRSEIWNAKLSDSNSNEFEMLELNLLSAVSHPFYCVIFV